MDKKIFLQKNFVEICKKILKKMKKENLYKKFKNFENFTLS